jgi:integrase
MRRGVREPPGVLAADECAEFMTTRKHRRRRIAAGVYADRYGITARVKVGSGPTALVAEERFTRESSLLDIRNWQDQQRADLRALRPQVRSGTLDAEISAYLRELADRPQLQRARAVYLAWWANYRDARGRRFGSRRRHSLTASELKAALANFASTPRGGPHRKPAIPAPSTVRHYRMALHTLWNALDGKSRPNPLGDVPAPRLDDPEPRAIPYAIIEKIFEAMPERGQGLRHQPRATVSKTKARLRLMAYTGLPPAQIMRLQPEHIDWDGASVLVHGRRKGKGSRPARLPLIPAALDALRAFAAASAWGSFSMSSVRATWWRAVRAMVDRLALTDYRAAKNLLDSLLRTRIRPYDLRHSYLTESYKIGRDLRATQALAMHSDVRMTERYTLAAVDPRLVDLAARLAASVRLSPTLSPDPPVEVAQSGPLLNPSRPRRSRKSTECARELAKSGLKTSAPGKTRTCDPRFRKPMLYPTELRAHTAKISV